MSDQPETLSAILAEMRGAAKSTDLFNGEEVGEPLIRGTKVEDWADRIEAAYEREHAEWHAETDAAKEDRNRIACRMRYEFAAKCRACKAEPGNAAALREALEEQLRYWDSHIRTRDEEEMRKRTEAALAAPARNCDRFADGDTASNAYEDEGGEKDYLDFARWLFATAEGGAR